MQNRLLLIIYIILSTCTFSYAAFPIQQYSIALNNANVIVPSNEHATIKTATDAEKAPKKKKGKKLELAAFLAFFFGTMGIHRFYLGYKAQGIVQAFTLPLLGAFLLIVSGPAAITGIAYFLVFMLGSVVLALSLWELIDFFRIAGNDLKPKNGQYKDAWE